MTAAEILAVLDKHTPSLTDENEERISYLITTDYRVEFDAADLAIRTCSCGEPIDGFYEYVDHLKSIFSAG